MVAVTVVTVVTVVTMGVQSSNGLCVTSQLSCEDGIAPHLLVEHG